MKYRDFNVKEHGFAGHLVRPDAESNHAVIVVMGGEKSLLPGIKIAERFADYGFLSLSVSLFGAEGLGDGIDRIPIEMFIPAVAYLKTEEKVSKISIYGMSMGSIFAALAAQFVGGIDNIVMVSPAHAAFEGTEADKKTMTGYSMATWQGQDIPFVKPDFSVGGMGKYVYVPQAGRKVTRMWKAYFDAYQDKALEKRAELKLDRTGARILLIAGTGDEAWPSDYSVKYMKEYLDRAGYDREYKMVLYPDVSHLTGMMPNRERNKMLYRLIPLIGVLYRSFGKHKKACMEALVSAEQEIIAFISRP